MSLEREVTDGVRVIIETVKDTITRNLVEGNGQRGYNVDRETLSAIIDLANASVEQASINSSATLTKVFKNVGES